MTSVFGSWGRIPVSTGSVAGSITTKPAGVSNADWAKYQSLSSKQFDPSHGPISSKNQKWYDAFIAQYGTAANPATGNGGGVNNPSGFPLPSAPLGYLPDVGLLSRPYSNPFEQRNLWNLFPGGTGQGGGVG